MNETCRDHYLNMPDIGGCPYCEIAGLRTELESLKAYVGNNHFRSDYKSADHMRAALEDLRKKLEEAQSTIEDFRQLTLFNKGEAEKQYERAEAAEAKLAKYEAGVEVVCEVAKICGTPMLNHMMPWEMLRKRVIVNVRES